MIIIIAMEEMIIRTMIRRGSAPTTKVMRTSPNHKHTPILLEACDSWLFLL